MRSLWRRRTALLVFALFLAVAPMPVAAAKPVTTAPRERAEQIVAALAQAGDPAQAFQQLAPEDRRLVFDYLAVARVISAESSSSAPSDAAMPLAAGCWQRDVLLRAVNVFNVTLWEYRVYLYWCGNGSSVTYYSTWSQATVRQLFWQYLGDIAQNTIGGVGYNLVRHFRQGHFALCVTAQYGCIGHVYPWADQTGYADGRYQSSYGGY